MSYHTTSGYMKRIYDETFNFQEVSPTLTIVTNWHSISEDRIEQYNAQSVLYAVNCIDSTLDQNDFYNILFASDMPFTKTIIQGDGKGAVIRSSEFNGAYFISQQCLATLSVHNEIISSGCTNSYAPYMAWDMIFADREINKIQIPVQYLRFDGETLEDTFEIEIVAEGEDTTPSEQEADPYDGAYDFEYNGSYYVFNRALVPDVHYSNGTVWQQSMDVTSPPYTVAQAETMGMIIQVAHSGSGHTGGEF